MKLLPLNLVYRLGTAFGHAVIIENLNEIQMPYCVPTHTSALAMLALSPVCKEARRQLVVQTNANHEALIKALGQSDVMSLGVGKPLGGNHANFVVLPTLNRSANATDSRNNARAKATSERLRGRHRVSVQFIGHFTSCEACLRITIGAEDENGHLVKSLISVLETC